MPVAEDLAFTPATELLDAFRSRSLSPVEVTEALLRRIEEVDADLNAFVTVTPEAALEQAGRAEAAYARGETGALLGVPVSVKDVVPTAGVRTTMGSLLFEDWVPDFDAPLVERLRDAGAVLLGKTNLPELGWKGDSGNRLCGPTRNPFDRTRTAGGSSGGAAAAVAAGLGPLAHGGDGAGSIRIPAAFCGVVGLKPSHGRVPYAPGGALELLVSEGPLARTVRDAALLLDVLAGEDARDRLSLPAPRTPLRAACERPVAGLRIAWSPDLGHAVVEPGVARAVATAVDAFTELGCHVAEVAVPWPDPLDDLRLLFSTAYAGLHASGYGRGLHDVEDLLDPGLLAVIEEGRRHSAADLTAAHLRRLDFAETVRRFMAPWDLLVTPTLPTTAFEAGRDHPESVAGRPCGVYDWLPFTYPFNLTGQPAVSVPAGLVDGLPVGLQIVGRWRDDATVLAAAAAYERVRPWNQR